MLHYFITTVKLYRTFRLESWKGTTLKQRANVAKAAYKMDGTRCAKHDRKSYGWLDLIFSPYRVQQVEKQD